MLRPQELALAKVPGQYALRVAVLLQLERAQQLLGAWALALATLDKAIQVCRAQRSSPDG